GASFAKIHKSDNASKPLNAVVFIDHVNFHAGDIHAALDVRNQIEPLTGLYSIMAAKEMSEEEMPVFIVIRRPDFKLAALHAAFDFNHIGLPALRGSDAGHKQFAKLQLCFYAKQALRAGNQAVVQRERYISKFNFLD